ncbi:MAG TPA: hypothetical protein VMZ91_03180, partial [Candidatus Paceibacterota bacterium]|nr:hypothetical protein [Candidatus Paceibacterota bacterium]
MSEKKKKYEERFYGMRMESDRDKNIKKLLMNLSEKRNIPVNRLIFNYLEKGLVLSEEKEITLDKTELKENFEAFIYELLRKVQNLENKLAMKNFEKKESLKQYISKKFPNKIEKKKFYLELLESQISCECDLLWQFFNIYDYKSEKHVGYFKFLSQKENIPFTNENWDKIFSEYQIKLYSRWFLELKATGVLIDLEKFKEIKVKKKKFGELFNYKALKAFILDLYKGRKLLYSQKEERIKSIEESQKQTIKRSKKRSLSNHLKSLFRKLIKDHRGLKNMFLNLEQDEYQLFQKIGYTPYIFYKILDLDGYIKFIDENNLRKALSNSFDQRHLFYKQLNRLYHFPPGDVIINIAFFFSYLKKLNQFLENLPDLLNQNAYSIEDIYKIGWYLKSLKQDEIKRSWYKAMLDELPDKRISELGEIVPKNYHQIINGIKEILKKYKIDLDSNWEELQKLSNKRVFEVERRLFRLYPDNMRTYIA